MKISNRKIGARLARLCSRQVERRMILDYYDFTMGSAFSATGQLRKRSTGMRAVADIYDANASISRL